MKKLTTILAALFITAATFAQAPQGFSYQAVVRDAQNAIVANKSVEVTVTILQGADAASATAVFSEKHNATTNANGLFTLTIGSVDAAKFAAINWAGGNLFLKTESAYGTATTQLLSVPFAMYAAKAASADIDLSEYAKKTDIPASANLEGYAKTADVDSLYAKKTDIPAIPDLSGYALKTDIPAAANLEGYAKTADIAATYATKTDLAAKVDKEEGKGLSTNDFTNELKSKLENDVLTAQDISGKLDATTAEATYAKTSDIETELAALKAVINKQGNTIALMKGEVVDLGLTSGTLWATCNLGATSPESYGDYYAWGEVETQASYIWRTYKYGTSETTLTKYNTLEANGTVDNKTTLDPEDDAATANFGAGWAMPTAEEFKELYNECYWKWTTDYNGTGVVGYIVYKSVDKTKDNQRTKGSDHTYSIATDAHIFLPAAGTRYDARLNNAGSAGYYWSSSLYTSRPDTARGCNFESGGVAADNNGSRYAGRSVRPVRRP